VALGGRLASRWAYYSWRLPPPRQLGGKFSVVKPARRLCGALEKDL
jgi:hypothetical protein